MLIKINLQNIDKKMKLTTLLTPKVEFEKRNGEKSIFID